MTFMHFIRIIGIETIILLIDISFTNIWNLIYSWFFKA